MSTATAVAHFGPHHLGVAAVVALAVVGVLSIVGLLAVHRLGPARRADGIRPDGGSGRMSWFEPAGVGELELASVASGPTVDGVEHETPVVSQS